MKKLKYIALAFAGILLAGCMGENFDEPSTNNIPYGNNSIDINSNIITIAQLKEMYAKQISTDYRDGNSYAQITDNYKIKAVVTSSNEQGNVYNEIALQDETGAIIAAVAEGDLYGFLPQGTEIVVDLKGLYIGNYGLQAEIGVPTTSKTFATYVGRMSRALWNQHYRIVGSGKNVEATAYDDGWDLSKDGGKLGIIKGVKFRINADSTFADPNAGAGSRSFDLIDSEGKVVKNVIVYNSNYADFASAKVPTGKVNIKGIFKRFNSQWEIIINSVDDIQPTAANDEVYKAGVVDLKLNGDGTEKAPYDVESALKLINAKQYTADKVYVSGIISKIDNVDTSTYGNATYYISDDGKTTTQLEVFRGMYLNGDKFTEATKGELAVGKKVVICGTLTLFKSTPEVAQGSSIISIK